MNQTRIALVFLRLAGTLVELFKPPWRWKHKFTNMTQTFQQLCVPADLIRGIEELGIEQPTEIQTLAIPFLIKEGTDLIEPDERKAITVLENELGVQFKLVE